MTADFVALLGSRALVPEEVRSEWSVARYVDLLAPYDDAERRVDRIVGREARSLRRIDPARARAVLTALADPPTSELNHARLARVADMPATTVGPYVDVLVELGVLALLPASRVTVAKRAVARPRVLFADLRLAAHLAGVDLDQLASFGGRSRLAPFLRALASLELVRRRPGSASPHRLGHLRERNGLAVDLVVELDDGGVFGVEVRTASSIRPHQFDALEALARRAGPRFRGGVVLNTAPVGSRYRPGLWSLPIASLWDDDQPDPPGPS